MAKVFIYEADHHCYTTPELGTDNDVIREQARKRTEGKYGSPNPESTVMHHHKKGVPCVGYHHEEFYTADRIAKMTDQTEQQELEEMRNSAPIE